MVLIIIWNFHINEVQLLNWSKGLCTWTEGSLIANLEISNLLEASHAVCVQGSEDFWLHPASCPRIQWTGDLHEQPEDLKTYRSDTDPWSSCRLAHTRCCRRIDSSPEKDDGAPPHGTAAAGDGRRGGRSPEFSRGPTPMPCLPKQAVILCSPLLIFPYFNLQASPGIEQ